LETITSMAVKKSPSFLTIMIVPSRSGRTVSWKIPTWVAVLGGSLFSLFALFSIVAFFFSFHFSFQIQDYKRLKTAGIIQENQISHFDIKLDDLKDEVKILFEKEEEIKNLLGEKRKSKRSRRKKKSLSKSYQFERRYRELVNRSKDQENLEDIKYRFLSEFISELKTSYSRLFVKVNQYKARYNRTPSIWPIYGFIKSGFGYRRHPILGKRVFHKGVDIPSWLGAPIKATAAGMIKFAAWSGGYGFTVIIDHGYGYQTVYAHNSRLLVRRGQYVQKGQKIAAIGSTGLSTAPHTHYEIRRWNKPINPRKYLDLDIFTASAQIW